MSGVESSNESNIRRHETRMRENDNFSEQTILLISQEKARCGLDHIHFQSFDPCLIIWIVVLEHTTRCSNIVTRNQPNESYRDLYLPVVIEMLPVKKQILLAHLEEGNHAFFLQSLHFFKLNRRTRGDSNLRSIPIHFLRRPLPFPNHVLYWSHRIRDEYSHLHSAKSVLFPSTKR